MKCSIDGCTDSSAKTSYCRKHYKRVYYHGDTERAKHSNRDHRPSIIDGEMAKIPLGLNAKDGYAIVDKEFAWLDKYKWHRSGHGYAAGVIILEDGSKKHETMHRYIISPEKQTVIDHINGNKLDNRLSNMRTGTQRQNTLNSIHRGGSSIFKGVCWDSRENKWRAYITVNRKRIELGKFLDELQAAKTYNTAALIYFGEWARVNEV